MRTYSPEAERLYAFVDGYNVYFGLRTKGWRHLYWLDYRALLETMVRPGQRLEGVSYFTARVTRPDAKRQRQGIYLDALAASGGVEIVEGTYEHRPFRCPDCRHNWKRPQEKQSDVNLATQMLLRAFDDDFDTALLVCADADLVPAVRLVRERFGKRVIVVSPPGRTSDALAREADAHLHFNKSKLSRSQLPFSVPGVGRSFDRPAEWS